MTGDVAYSGKAEEYAKAYDFFRNRSVVLSVPQHNFFFVPGNLVVDRSVNW